MIQTDEYGADWSASLRRGSPAELAGFLRFANGAADEADRIALAALESELSIDRKSDGSFVTEADREIERLIRERIADAYPTHGIVGEEFGDDGARAADRWYVDPIDGTHNYMRGVPLFGTLIALERDGEFQVGVASAPAVERRWYASRGEGAWMIGGPGGSRPRRLHVSHIDSLQEAQVVFRSVNDMHDSRVSAGFDRLIREVWRERGFGDFWGYTLVAEAAAEAMVERDLGPWDLGAPWVLIEEAGGRITDFDGRRSLDLGEGLATNGRLHERILERLRSSP